MPKNKYIKTIKIKNLPVVCHIPHSSIVIPTEFKKDFLIGQSELTDETLQMADFLTDKLYKKLLKHAGGIIAQFSRVVVDIERFTDDKKEKMAKMGMGALYTRSGGGKIIRKFSQTRKEKLFKTFYYPYYRELNRLIQQCLNKFGQCLILDCHSFPDQPRPYELSQSANRPDICIGTNPFHTPPQLVKILVDNFEKNKFKVKKNSPFQGALVSPQYYQKSKQVKSIMIEVNRKLYMDEKKFQLNPDFDAVADLICNIILNGVKKYS